MIVGLTGAWAYSLFGFIAAAMMPLPFVIYTFGPRFRARSPHGHEKKGVMPPRMQVEKGLQDMGKVSSVA